MRLRTKTMITVALVSLLIFGALQLVTLLVIQPSFASLENQNVMQGISQARSVIDYRLSQLEGKVKDYSFWDDTYNFVQNRNDDYVENNFVDVTFENLGLNLVAVVDENRSIVYCQSFDLNNSVKVQTSEETERFLSSDDYIWAFQSDEEALSGLVLINGQPALVASASILTSLNEGPAMGGMIFAKYIDYQEISELTMIMRLNFSLQSVSDFKDHDGGSQIVGSLVSGEQAIVKPTSPDIVLGYALVSDIHANQDFILTTIQSRTAYQQGVVVGNIFTLAAVLILLSFGAFIMVLLENDIVKPMVKLATYVEEISLNPNISEPVSLAHSSEEIHILANSVKETLKRKLEGMNEVSRMVGHDLRNPLTGIKGAVYVLRKNHVSKVDKKGNDLLKTIEDCVEYSDKIVRDLLEYSCEIKLDKTEASPRQLVDGSLSTIVVPSNIQLINEADGEFSVSVDTGKIERVFTNLIKNAFDAMPEGGRLKITSGRVNGQVEMDFSDNGVGMSKAILDKLWTPFFTTKAKGMGVGLSICKRIIESHGGRIEVKSMEGKGTTFAVFLPLGK
jgi:signal transduction histidine kinase